MDKFIRKQTVFNTCSPREMKIWHWIVKETNDFKDQRYSAFVRDQLEMCMNQEFTESVPENKPEWRNLI